MPGWSVSRPLEFAWYSMNGESDVTVLSIAILAHRIHHSLMKDTTMMGDLQIYRVIGRRDH